MSDASQIHHLHLDGKELNEQFAGENTAAFRFSRFYINNSSEKISVLHRNNLTVPTRNGLDLRYPQGDFIVRTIWYFNGINVFNDVRRSIAATLNRNKSKSVDLGILDKYLRDAHGRNPNSPRVSVVIDRIVPARVIRELGIVYLHEEDLVLSLESRSHEIMHPFSSEGYMSHDKLKFIEDSQASGMFIELIDNERNTSSRFMFIGKKVVEIHAKTDVNRKSGVYYSHIERHPLSGDNLERQYCTVEQAEEYVGLYKTRDDAISGGNPEIISKTEFELAKREAAEANSRLEEAKLETAFVKEELAREQAKRADHFEERKYARTDYYDDRSATRKDNSEIYKMVGAAIVGAGAAWVAYAKLKNGNSK
jgi:hypothetical protein